jgi:hypothetical protein
VRRVSNESIIMATIAAVMAMMVLILGVAILPSPTPPAPPVVGGGRGVTSLGDCLEATVTALQGSGIAGGGWLCLDGDGVRPTLRLIGLTPRQEYSAWLGYTTQVFADPPTSSGTIVWRGGEPEGQPRLLGEGVAPSTGEMEFRGEFSDLRFAGRAQVTLLLLRPGGPAGPHAQVIFIIP